MSNDYLESAKLRQKRYSEQKREQGFHKIQVYISDYDYSQLLEMKENKKKSFSEIISASIACKYRYWQKYRVYDNCRR